MSITTVEAVADPARAVGDRAGVEAVADSEVRPARQVYPARDTLKVLAELDAADSKSARGEILRREGVYSSLVSEWRKQRDRGALETMRQKRPGRTADPVRVENARLRARVGTHRAGRGPHSERARPAPTPTPCGAPPSPQSSPQESCSRGEDDFP